MSRDCRASLDTSVEQSNMRLAGVLSFIFAFPALFALETPWLLVLLLPGLATLLMGVTPYRRKRSYVAVWNDLGLRLFHKGELMWSLPWEDLAGCRNGRRIPTSGAFDGVWLQTWSLKDRRFLPITLSDITRTHRVLRALEYYAPVNAELFAGPKMHRQLHRSGKPRRKGASEGSLTLADVYCGVIPMDGKSLSFRCVDPEGLRRRISQIRRNARISLLLVPAICAGSAALGLPVMAAAVIASIFLLPGVVLFTITDRVFQALERSVEDVLEWRSGAWWLVHAGRERLANIEVKLRSSMFTANSPGFAHAVARTSLGVRLWDLTAWSQDAPRADSASSEVFEVHGTYAPEEDGSFAAVASVDDSPQ